VATAAPGEWPAAAVLVGRPAQQRQAVAAAAVLVGRPAQQRQAVAVAVAVVQPAERPEEATAEPPPSQLATRFAGARSE
jgi:hypothetical protein